MPTVYQKRGDEAVQVAPSTDEFAALEKRVERIEDNPSGYVLPVASSSVLGGVKPDGKTFFVGSGGVASVPAYNGATASSGGTAGLVPPAPAGVANRFLSPGGEWVHGTTREILTAKKTLYVRMDGNDANDGSADDAAHAFRTINAAIEYATSRYVLINGIGINIGAGVWSEPLMLKSYLGAGYVVIRGVGPQTVLEGSDTTLVAMAYGTTYALENMTVRYTRTANVLRYILAAAGASMLRLENIAFEIADNADAAEASLILFSTESPYSFIHVAGDCSLTITGTNTRAAVAVASSIGGYIQFVGNMAVSGKVRYFTYIRRGGFANFACVFSGSMTGTRYKVEYAGICTSGRGPDYLPGDAEGIVGPHGYYE